MSVDFVASKAASFRIDATRARTVLEAEAQALKGFSVRRARASEVGWQLTAQMRMATERSDEQDPSKVRRALGASAELRRLAEPEDGSPRSFSAEVLDVRSVPRGAPSEGHVSATLGRLLARLQTSVRLWRAGPGEVSDAVAGADEHARAVAIRVAGARRLSGARAALETRLRDDQTSVQEALRLTAALAEIGDSESTGAIIDAASRHPAATIPLVFVLARLGGREAEAYLFTVRNGHENPEVRAAARDALKGLGGPPRASDAR